MPLFDNKKAAKKSLRDIPEGTTEKEKPKNGVVQWIKNSGHSVKGVFLEWLSEQQLFTVVNDEIKMIKQEHKKRKMSPQEKKTFKQKVAGLSDDAIKKFGELYLGTNSSQEAKDKIKEGIQTVLGQIKSGNFYHKANAFGDDEFDAFMDDLEDEWEDDQEASGEVFMLNDIINKHGFGEFMGRSWVDQHIQEDVVDKDGEEITILVKLPDKQKEPTEEQQASLEQLKKQVVRNAINQNLKTSLSKEISEMNEGNLTYSYYRIMEYTIFPDNKIEGAVYTQFKDKSGIMDSETNEFKYVPITLPKISKESYINNILHKHGFGEFMKLKQKFDDVNEKYTMKTWGMTVKELQEYQRTHQGMTPLTLKRKQKLEQQRLKKEGPKPEKEKYKLNQYGEYRLDDETKDTKFISVIIKPKSENDPRPSEMAKLIVSKESEIIALAKRIFNSQEFKKFFKNDWDSYLDVIKDEGEDYFHFLANNYWDINEDGDLDDFRAHILKNCEDPSTIRFFYDEKTKKANLEFGFYADEIFQGFTKSVSLKDIGINQTRLSESFILSNILNRSGLGEMVNLSKYNVSTKPVSEKAKLDKIIYKSGFGEFMKPGKPKFQQEEIYDQNNDAIQIFFYYPKGETEINDLQKSILEDLKDPKERAKINKDAKNQLTKRGALDDEEYTIKYDKIASFEVTPDGVISGTAYGWFTSKSNPDQKPTYDEIGYDVEITSYEEKKPQGEFMKPGNKNTVTWDLDIENGESLEVEFTLSRNQKEPNELQKSIFEKLKDPKVRKELNDYARSKSSTESDDGEYNIKFKFIHYFKIRQDGMMFVDTYGYYTNKKSPLDYYSEEIDHMIPISKFKGGK